MKQETKVVLGMIGVCLVIFIGIIFLSDRGTSPQNSLSDTQPIVDQTVLVREDSKKIEVAGSKITLVEFADFECESCGAAHPILKKIKEEYKEKMTFVFRNFPLHGNSVLAAKAAEAAGEQGKFWEMHDKLFENQKQWGEKQTPQTELFRKYAQELGLNMTNFNTVIASTKYEDKIARDKNDGVKAGVTGTPTFYLNGKIIKGVPTYAQLKQLIDSELNK
ncbi:MAG: DsbA family protein [Patescibacteria group bacterium]